MPNMHRFAAAARVPHIAHERRLTRAELRCGLAPNGGGTGAACQSEAQADDALRRGLIDNGMPEGEMDVILWR